MRDRSSCSRIACVDLGDAVPVHRHPQRRDSVEIPVAVGVDELEAVRALDDERLVVEPVLHLRERVPEVRAIEIGEAPRAIGSHGSQSTTAAADGDRAYPLD